MQAYCPIVRNQRAEDPALQPLVKKYGKTPCQVLLRWSLQKVGALFVRLAEVGASEGLSK